MRKKLSVSILLLTIMTAAWMTTGCGDKAQDDAVSQTEELNRTEQSSNVENDAEQENDKEDGQDETEQGQAEGESSDKSVDADKDASADEGANKSVDASDASPNEPAELCVDVESIGDNSVVGNKVFIETLPDGNGEIMLVGVGGDDQELVTVHFEENASYVYEIIRNGGADVETREGSFSDIGLDMILDLTGYYKGEDFYADKVVISNVILD